MDIFDLYMTRAARDADDQLCAVFQMYMDFFCSFICLHQRLIRCPDSMQDIPDNTTYTIGDYTVLLALPADIGRKPASPARGSRQRLQAGESRLRRNVGDTG